jgi:hypothetical protein
VKLEIDLDLSAHEAVLSSLRAALPAQIGSSFGSNENLMSRLARCATLDLLTWLADGPPTTASAWREQRLVTIADEVFGGGVPNEAFVAELFALTTGEARSLIRRTLARHRRRMSATVRESLTRSVREATSAGKKAEQRFYVTMEPAVFDFAEELLARRPDGLQPIVPRDEGINRFEIPVDSMKVIVAALGLQMTDVGSLAR